MSQAGNASDEPHGGAPGGPVHGDPPADAVAGRPPPLEITSEALLAGRNEVRIRHRGEIYRLTLTRAGKLILHK